MHKILAVDNDRTLLKLLELVLSVNNYNVDIALGGLDALRQFKLNTYDLVITDICMPDLNGYDLAHQLRTKQRNLPILALTGEAFPLAEPFDLIIKKPFYSSELIDIIGRLLPQKNRDSSPKSILGSTCQVMEQPLQV